jgi:hypothetical protein
MCANQFLPQAKDNGIDQLSPLRQRLASGAGAGELVLNFSQ